MGVHTRFFSFDEAFFTGLRPGPLTMDALDELGALTEDGDVDPRFAGELEDIDSIIGWNNRWYDNLAADTVYGRLRECLAPEVRERTDPVFRLLFWDGEPGVEHTPLPVPPPHHDREASCYVYGPDTVAYLAGQDPSLEEIRPVFEACMEEWELHGEHFLGNMDAFDTFQWWVDVWLTVFRQAAAGDGAPRALLVYVSY